MAMIVFTLLSGLGVIFLLYVLYQFWKEGRRSQDPSVIQYEIDLSVSDRPQVFVMTHPISFSADGGISELPMRARKLKRIS